MIATFLDMSKEAESSVAMWAAISAIVIAALNLIPSIMSTWLTHKGNAQNAKILEGQGKTQELVAENTEVTEKTAKRVNGVLDAAKAEAHELGYMKGKAEALAVLTAAETTKR